jgi:hypothetical protein
LRLFCFSLKTIRPMPGVRCLGHLLAIVGFAVTSCVRFKTRLLASLITLFGFMLLPPLCFALLSVLCARLLREIARPCPRTFLRSGLSPPIPSLNLTHRLSPRFLILTPTLTPVATPTLRNLKPCKPFGHVNNITRFQIKRLGFLSL